MDGDFGRVNVEEIESQSATKDLTLREVFFTVDAMSGTLMEASSILALVEEISCHRGKRDRTVLQISLDLRTCVQQLHEDFGSIYDLVGAPLGHSYSNPEQGVTMTSLRESQATK